MRTISSLIFSALILIVSQVQGAFQPIDTPPLPVLDAGIQSTCPAIANTPNFTFAYGDVLLNSATAPVGSIIQAKSPRGELVGCTMVTEAGKYGAIVIYGEDLTVTPSIPGMKSGEVVTFYINNLVATSSPSLYYASDKDLHSVNLSASGISAPVPNFTAPVTSGNAPLSVQFSDQSAGTITNWAWNFGDGSTSSQQNPQHTYTARGVYTVALTVTGPGGSSTETKTDYIHVYQQSVADFSGSPTAGIAPLTVNFTNLSSGDYINTNWSFGDAQTSTASSPSHVYNSPGTYTVSLSISGAGGSDTETKSSYITVYASVDASFTVNHTDGIAPLTVQFTNTSTGGYSALSWNFGDGSALSSETNPTHTFPISGIYTVVLTATGPGGTDTYSQQIQIYQPAQAAFSANVQKGKAPLTVQFTNQSTGDVNSYSWDFGDGENSTEQNPDHIYTQKGTYTVSLTVSGAGGTATETKTGYIVVINEYFVFIPLVLR